MTFKDLKKLAASDPTGLPQHRLAVLGDTATQFLVTAIRGVGVARGLDLVTYEAGYDQVDRQVHDPGAELYAHAPDVVLLHLSAEKLHAAFDATAPAERAGFAVRELARLEALWAAIRAHAGAGVRILACTYPELDDGVWGNYAAMAPASFRHQLRKLNLGLMEAAAQAPGVFVVDLAALQARLGRARSFDRKLYYAAKLAIALEALPEVARQVVDVIEAAFGRVRKCLVLDLDNTLWGGVIGEDGLAGIQVGDLGQGPAFTDLQRWARGLRERGVLLAVCSKNDDAVAREPFERHPDMVLRLADIAVFVANWATKVDNLLAIRDVLDIGLDAMVFLDDNPFEREMVRQHLPEVCVPELPEDPAAWLDHLVGLNLFEVAAASAADADRTAQYQAEAERRVARATFTDVDDYLASLAMAATVGPFDAFRTPRIAQLSQRSNQFNLRTVRYTEADVARLASSEAHVTRWFELADRFGDHGLVGVAVLERVDAASFFIDTWLMSCRVLKRGMEAFMLAAMAEAARAAGATRLVGEYLPTAKNGLVAELLPGLGFVAEGGRWALDLATYAPAPGHIAKMLTETVPSGAAPLPARSQP